MPNTISAYNKIAKEFSYSRVYKWEWITDFIKNINKKNDNFNVLDLGCGNGRNMELYKNYNKINFFGIDNSINFINICKKKGLNVKEGDMCSLLFENNYFDNILCIASFHHLDSIDKRITCLQEINRVIKKGGEVLISVWSINQPKKTKRVFEKYGDIYVPWVNKNKEIINRYYYIFMINEIKSLIENNGFKINLYKWDCGNEIFIIEKL